MASPPTNQRRGPLPDIAERLVAPESGYEIVDGSVIRVSPCDPPHGERHAIIVALIEAHIRDDYTSAVDLLTRTSQIDDIAPDVSVYLRALNPKTGRRHLEELAFEVVSTESLGDAGVTAAKLVGRGVRRVFAIDVERRRCLEWSRDLGTWSILAERGVIEDPVFVLPLRVDDLVRSTASNDAVARVLRARNHPEFSAERAEGRMEGRTQVVIEMLDARGLHPDHDERATILEERHVARVDGWLARVTTCTSVSELLAD